MNKKHPSQSARLTFEDVVQKACAEALASGSHSPVFLIQGSSSWVIVPVPDVETATERQEQVFEFGRYLAREKGVGQHLEDVYFICEAWIGNPELPHPPTPPSEDPNRHEILIVTRMSGNGQERQAAAFTLLRDSEGKLITLQPVSQNGRELVGFESPLLQTLVEGFRLGRG